MLLLNNTPSPCSFAVKPVHAVSRHAVKKICPSNGFKSYLLIIRNDIVSRLSPGFQNNYFVLFFFYTEVYLFIFFL